MSLARFVCGVFVVLAISVTPAAAFAAPGVDQTPTWVVTLDHVTAYSGPSEEATSFGDMPASVTLQLLEAGVGAVVEGAAPEGAAAAEGAKAAPAEGAKGAEKPAGGREKK